MSDLWTVRRDYSHVISHEDARLIGASLLEDAAFVDSAVLAGAVVQDVPGFGRAVFGVEWDLDLLVERYDAVREGLSTASFVRLDQAVEAVREDSLELAPRRRATFERFALDYLDRGAGAEKTPGSVVGAAFAAILPAMGPDGAAEEFGRSMELMARESFIEPVSLLWDPIEEILDWIRPGHLWRIAETPVPAAQMPAPRMRDDAESVQPVARP